MDNIKTVTFNKSSLQDNKTLFGKILPYLLIISFLPIALKSALSVSSSLLADIYGEMSSKVLIIEIIVIAIIQFFILKLMLWFYKKLMAMRPFYFLVGDSLFTEKFYLSYLIRNVALFGFVMLSFYFPVVNGYYAIFQTIVSFAAISLTYVLLSKHIDITFRQLFYKNMMWPWFAWQILSLVLALILGGII